MKMTASTLKPNDLVIAISGTGRTREVVEAVALAKHYRAKAIAITAPDTDLAGGSRPGADRRRAGISRPAEAHRLALRLPRHHRPRLDRGRLPARPAARETLRRIKYTVLNHRKGKVLEPLGD